LSVLTSLPPELEAFIQSQVDSGKYSSADEAVTEAVRLLQEREQHFACLKSDLEEGLAAFERGEFIAVNSEADRQGLIDDIARRGRERLNGSRGTR
jgi:antitoxin ParD1/3/4